MSAEEDDNHAVLPPVAIQVTKILFTMLMILMGLVQCQQLQQPTKDDNSSSSDKTTTRKRLTTTTLFLPDPTKEPSKYLYEQFCMWYTPIWITCFGYIVASGIYETYTKWSYLKVCIGLSLPFLIQPMVWMSNEEQRQPLVERYSFKANVWIGTFSFIGNYWYTQYFYSVLKAQYTMPAHRLNNVPIALYFATHFYFSTYHFFSNVMLRVIHTRYQSSFSQKLLKWNFITCFSYFTAFMETLTISSFPYYSFENRDMAYTVGSAFYGIYFLVSFPMFYELRETQTLWETFVNSCGCGMIVLCLLDFVRLYLQIPLTVDIGR